MTPVSNSGTITSRRYDRRELCKLCAKRRSVSQLRGVLRDASSAVVERRVQRNSLFRRREPSRVARGRLAAFHGEFSAKAIYIKPSIRLVKIDKGTETVTPGRACCNHKFQLSPHFRFRDDASIRHGGLQFFTHSPCCSPKHEYLRRILESRAHSRENAETKEHTYIKGWKNIKVSLSRIVTTRR